MRLLIVSSSRTGGPTSIRSSLTREMATMSLIPSFRCSTTRTMWNYSRSHASRVAFVCWEILAPNTRRHPCSTVQEPSGRVFQLHQIKTTSTSTNFQVLLLMVGVPGSEVPLSSRWKVLTAFTLPNYASCINEAITLFGNVSLPVTKCLER